MRIALFVALTACGPTGPSSVGGNDTPGDDVPGTDAPIGPSPDGARTGSGFAELDEPALVVIVGDSIGAGFNAANNNAQGGRGYARLVTDNHAAYPAFAQRNIRTFAPNVMFKDIAHSGDNSDEAKARVHGASWPAVNGDVLVLISVGGNDFNDSINTMLSTSATATAASNLRANLADIVGFLRGTYENEAAGHEVVFAVNNIHDPTDGTGTIPSQFDDGFCGTIQNPLFTPQLRQTALTNLGTMNAAIAAEVTAQNAQLVDMHAGFMGHGMNGGNERWLDGDCAHPTSDGHHHLREIVWSAIGGP